MLTTDQENFLKANPVGVPAEITIESPVVAGAKATVSMTGGTYWQALEVLAWVASQAAAKIVADEPKAKDAGEGILNEWELADPELDFTAILRLYLSSPDDFEEAAKSIADQDTMVAAARKLYRDRSEG